MSALQSYAQVIPWSQLPVKTRRPRVHQPRSFPSPRTDVPPRRGSVGPILVLVHIRIELTLAQVQEASEEEPEEEEDEEEEEDFEGDTLPVAPAPPTRMTARQAALAGGGGTVEHVALGN
jgi:hypothetical protein